MWIIVQKKGTDLPSPPSFQLIMDFLLLFLLYQSFQEIYSAAWYYGDEEYYATGEYEHRYDALDDGDFFTDYNSASQFARDRAGDDCVAYGVIKWEIIDIKIVEE
jgi:hypothetical protein